MGPMIFNCPDDRGFTYRKFSLINIGTHTTIVYNVFVLMQIINALLSRSLDNRDYNIFKNIFQNKIFISIQVFILIIQVGVVQFGNMLMGTNPLDFFDNVLCIIFACISLISIPIIKLIDIKIIVEDFDKEEADSEIDENENIEKENDFDELLNSNNNSHLIQKKNRSLKSDISEKKKSSDKV